MKPQKTKIKPSHRPKKRYLLFEIKQSSGIASSIVRTEVLSHFKRFFKEKFFEKNIWIIGFYEGIGLGILRCSHTAVDEIKVALASFRQLHSNGVKTSVLLSSGSIKKIKERIKRLSSLRT